jgi:N-methylhydantoinase B
MDGIELELFHRRLSSVAEEMGEVLRRGAFSPNIKERLDHSCALFDADGDMVAQAAHIPVHLGAAPLCAKAVLDRMSLSDGQTAIVNDPFAGGTHLPDITIVTAVDLGDCRMYVASRAHHADVGGISPGSLPLSRTIDEEGWCCEPTLLTDDVVRSLCEASRTPHERRGDLAAQRAANRRGKQRLEELATEFGAEKIREASEALQSYTETLVGEYLGSLPVGTWSAEQFLEGTLDSEEPVGLRLDLSINASRELHFDFTKSDDQAPGPTNAVRAIVESAVFYVLLCLCEDRVPANSGVMRHVTITTRRGSVVDAKKPAAVAAGNVETSQRIVDLLMEAFVEVVGERMPALACGSMNNVLIGSRDGGAPDRAFVYYETLAGGYGASSERDGASATHAHMTNTRNTPIEAFEHAYPARIVRYSLREGSGGSGSHRGGDGLIRAYEFLVPSTVTVLAERRVHGPSGRAGGGAGMPGVHRLIRKGEEPYDLGGKTTVSVSPGDRLIVETPGGGGWGG